MLHFRKAKYFFTYSLLIKKYICLGIQFCSFCMYLCVYVFIVKFNHYNEDIFNLNRKFLNATATNHEVTLYKYILYYYVALANEATHIGLTMRVLTSQNIRANMAAYLSPKTSGFSFRFLPQKNILCVIFFRLCINLNKRIIY